MKSASNSVSIAADPERSGSPFRRIMRQTVLRAREGQLPVARQLLEMAILRLFYGLGPGFYHTARFWRKDLSWEFKTGFWPYKKFRHIVNRINSPSYQKLSQHKVSEKAILQLVGVPTPRFIGNLHHQRGRSSSGTSLTSVEELRTLLLDLPDIHKVCFKLVEGYGGHGFQAVEVLRDDDLKLRPLDANEPLTVSEFFSGYLTFDKGGEYIVEEYIKQHPDLARLNPSSVNTLRIWACCVEGETFAINAFLRVGGHGALVDNTSRGAHIFRLNFDTGEIEDGMVKNIYNDTFQCHRDSGERISGSKLPFWQDALKLACEAVTVFPHINLAGVDVAFTEKGPVVIELNVEPDPTSALIFDRSHRELLSCFKKNIE